MRNFWEKAKQLSIQTGKDIVGGFDVGFDAKISEEMKDTLMDFLYWAEDNYHFPITLWVDFKYNHYLVDERKKRVNYRFYWVDDANVAFFDRYDDIPVIELPARCEKRGMDEVLKSLIAAISCYFAWLCGEDVYAFQPDAALTKDILQKYQLTRGE